MEKEVCVTAGRVLVEMHVTNWATAQKEDPKLDALLCWLEAKKKVRVPTFFKGKNSMTFPGSLPFFQIFLSQFKHE